MLNLHFIESEFKRYAKGRSVVFWSIKPDYGKGSNNMEKMLPDESWHLLESNIINAAEGGARKVKVTLKNSQTDPKGWEYQVQVPYNYGTGQQQAQQSTGISGMGGASIMGLMQTQLQQQLQAAEERSAARMEAMQREWQHQKEIEARENEIASLRHSQASAIDRLLEKVDESPVLQQIAGNIMSAFTGGGKNPQIAGTQIQEVPAAAVENEENSDVLDFNSSIQASLILQQAGYKDAGAIHLAVSNFIIQNPDLAYLFRDPTAALALFNQQKKEDE